MRHGKSDWDADYQSDHERPLDKRGIRSARLVGRLYSALDLAPEHVISSTAVRARTTAELAAEAGAWGCSVELEEGFYGSGAETVLELGSTAPEVARLMLVGHQPTWGMLLRRLTGATASMKTACVAEITLDIDTWSELGQARGVLSSLINPRPLFGSEWDETS